MATFSHLLQEELARRTSEPSRRGPQADPFDPGSNFKEAEKWVVDLHRPFQDLARVVAESRAASEGQSSKTRILAGAWGSGKTLLIRLFQETARRLEGIEGAITDAKDILQFSEEHGSALEDKVSDWRERHAQGLLHYILVDNAPWVQVVSGRLNQLTKVFPGRPPAIVFVVDFTSLRDLEARMPNIRSRLDVVRIPPYRAQDLLDIWNLHFGNLAVPPAEMDRVLQAALGNPRLLLLLGNALAKEVKERPSSDVSGRLVQHVLKKNGFEVGVRIRNGDLGERKAQPLEEQTRLHIMVRVAQRSTGKDDGPGGITATELSRDYEIDRSLCSYHLTQLEKDGFVFSYRTGAQVNYATWGAVRVALENFTLMAYD